MSATVETTTSAVETTAAVETTTAVEAGTTMEAATDATVESASRYRAYASDMSGTVATPVAVASAIAYTEAASAIAPVASTKVATTEAVIRVEPRTGTDKDAAIEPLRAVIPIRGTCVRIVVVVAVTADGRSICIRCSVPTTDADTDSNLCLCCRSGSHHCKTNSSRSDQSERANFFEVRHDQPRFRPKGKLPVWVPQE